MPEKDWHIKMRHDILDQNRAVIGEPVEVFCAAFFDKRQKRAKLKMWLNYCIFEPDARLL